MPHPLLQWRSALLAGPVLLAMFALRIGSDGNGTSDPVVITEAAPVFTDYRSQSPGRVHQISPVDLPLPYASRSAASPPRIIERPANAWPRVPAGFQVQMYANKLAGPRRMRTAPNGDVFVALTGAGKIAVLRGIDGKGQARTVATFASGLKKPFGIAFYPPGPQPQWMYVATTGAVVRFPYRNGDLSVRGPEEEICELPGAGFLFAGGHDMRDLEFSRDGKVMYVSVGSRSNADDTDGNRAEKDRGTILLFNPDGSDQRTYAWGIRNPSSIAVHPASGELWTSVNERDNLGDNLVPDYITHVSPNGFYGWPWFYIGGLEDPQHKGKHPELKDWVITPDVLLQPHNASMQMHFYTGKQFPKSYQGDIFAAQHGSWNRSVRTGYEVIRIPMHGSTRAENSYQDFMTGFVTEEGKVWGRPVGVAEAADGSLLVSDDAGGVIWRISSDGREHRSAVPPRKQKTEQPPKEGGRQGGAEAERPTGKKPAEAPAVKPGQATDSESAGEETGAAESASPEPSQEPASPK